MNDLYRIVVFVISLLFSFQSYCLATCPIPLVESPSSYSEGQGEPEPTTCHTLPREESENTEEPHCVQSNNQWQEAKFKEPFSSPSWQLTPIPIGIFSFNSAFLLYEFSIRSFVPLLEKISVKIQV